VTGAGGDELLGATTPGAGAFPPGFGIIGRGARSEQPLVRQELHIEPEKDRELGLANAIAFSSASVAANSFSSANPGGAINFRETK
jgi:hypothetical protein